MKTSTAERPASSPSLLWGLSWTSLPYAFGQLVRVIRGLVIPKLLGPAQYGLWTSLSLPLPYLTYCDLGVKKQLDKRLPFVLTREDEKEFQALANKGLTWTVATSLIASAAVVILALQVQGEHAWFYRTGLLLLALVFVLQKVRLLLSAMLVAKESFRDASLGKVLLDGAGVLFAILFLVTFGVLGLVWALLLAEITVLIYYSTRVDMPRLTRRLEGIVDMVREGGTLLLIGLLDVALGTVDQLFIVRFFPVEQYGIYSVGGFLTGLLLSASGIVFTVTQPRVMGLSGSGRNQAVRRTIETSMDVFIVAISVLPGLAILGLALVTRLYLTDYWIGMPLYALMTGLAIVRGPVLVMRPYFLSHNRERYIILSQLIGLVPSVLFNLLAIRLGGEIELIVFSSIAAYTLVSILLVASFELGNQNLDRRRLIQYSPLCLALLGIIMLHIFWRNLVAVEQTFVLLEKVLGLTTVYTLVVGVVVLTLNRSQIRALLSSIQSRTGSLR